MSLIVEPLCGGLILNICHLLNMTSQNWCIDNHLSWCYAMWLGHSFSCATVPRTNWCMTCNQTLSCGVGLAHETSVSPVSWASPFTGGAGPTRLCCSASHQSFCCNFLELLEHFNSHLNLVYWKAASLWPKYTTECSFILPMSPSLTLGLTRKQVYTLYIRQYAILILRHLNPSDHILLNRKSTRVHARALSIAS